MLKDVFEFPCPCCGKRIELDTRTGLTRAIKVEEKLGKDLDGLLADSKQESHRLDSIFQKSKDQVGKQKERLEDMFGKAIDEAKKDQDKTRPRNPFDLE